LSRVIIVHTMSCHKTTAKKITADDEDRIEEVMEGKAPTNLHDLGSQVAEELIKTRLLVKKHALATAGDVDDEGKKVTEDDEVVQYLKDRMTCLLAAFNCIQRSPKLALEIGAEGMEKMLGYLSKKAQERAAEAEVNEYVEIVRNKLPGVKLSVKAGLVKPSGAHL
jgi:hypothetical protein